MQPFTTRRHPGGSKKKELQVEKKHENGPRIWRPKVYRLKHVDYDGCTLLASKFWIHDAGKSKKEMHGKAVRAKRLPPGETLTMICRQLGRRKVQAVTLRQQHKCM